MTLRASRIIWAAMTVSVLLYFVLAKVVMPETETPDPNIDRILLIMASAYVAITFPAKHWLLKQAESAGSQRLRNIALILPLVLCEAAAVTGVALRLAFGSPHYYYFLLLGLAGMLLHFPVDRKA